MVGFPEYFYRCTMGKVYSYSQAGNCWNAFSGEWCIWSNTFKVGSYNICNPYVTMCMCVLIIIRSPDTHYSVEMIKGKFSCGKIDTQECVIVSQQDNIAYGSLIKQ